MIACLSIPYFAAAVERRADSGLCHKPLAIGGQPWEARPVYAFSREVAHKGVEIGMSLRLVQVLSPTSTFMPAAENRYSLVAGEVVDVLTDFSHLIEPEELWHPLNQSRHPTSGTRQSLSGTRQPLTAHARPLPARYCLDLDGLSERDVLPFIRTMGRSVRQETEMIPAIGLARQKFTAQVAATVCRTSHALPVKQGEEPAFLAPRSLSFLPLEKEMARRLRLLGVYTMGQLTGLSLPALQEQFGSQITPFYHLARGEEAEPVHAPPPELGEVCAFVFDDAVANLQVINSVADRLVAELVHRLQTKSLQARIVRLLVEMEEDPPQQRQLTLRQPSGSASRLGTAVQELISSEPFPSPVTSIKIALPHLVSAQVRQLTLFEATALSPHAQRAIDNVALKYRQSRFFQPQTTDITHPLPERRFHLQPYHDALVA